MSHPAFSSQTQCITALWLVPISRPTEGRRLSWPGLDIESRCIWHNTLSVRSPAVERTNPRVMFSGFGQYFEFSSVLLRCPLGDSNGIQPVKNPSRLSPKILLRNTWRKKTKGKPADADSHLCLPFLVVQYKERKGNDEYLYNAICTTSESTQTWITQFYLQITPCLSFLRK